MSTLRAVVQNGRAIIEDVGDYEDGTVLELEVVVRSNVAADPVDRHDPGYLERIASAPREEKEAALAAALDAGIAQLDAGEVVTGTPSELMKRIDERLGMKRDAT